MAAPLARSVGRARTAVLVSFALNGLGFASWASRIPEVRERLSLSNAQLGLLLLVLAAGSAVALPTTGALVRRWGAARVVRAGVLLDVAGSSARASSRAGWGRSG
ncbi:MAG: hypothetical protein R2731_15000 [Nocardioides sp.]